MRIRTTYAIIWRYDFVTEEKYYVLYKIPNMEVMYTHAELDYVTAYCHSIGINANDVTILCDNDDF